MTAQQKRLMDVGPATGNLTDRQAAALEILQAHPAGLRSIDLGRRLHMRLGPCRVCSGEVIRTTCGFAHSAGEEVGKALRRKDPPLAIKRRTGLWQATVRAPVPETPWPEDFF